MKGEVALSEPYDFKSIVADIYTYLRVKTTPIGIKAFEHARDVDSIPKCRRPQVKYSACQILGQAINVGWTVAMAADDFGLEACPHLLGLKPQTEEWKQGQSAVGVWYAEPEDGKKHLDTYPYIPYGKYEAYVASPLASGHIQDPDVCMVVGLPAQIFILLTGLQRHDYRPLDTPFVGEDSCSQHWVRTFMTGKPNISLPCFAELRFGQFPEDSVIFTSTPADLKKAIEGVKELHKFGLRYPIPGYGVLVDVQRGHDKSYKKK